MIYHGKKIVLIDNHNNITGVSFTIASTKPFVPVVTLSINENIKFLENVRKDSKEQFT